MATLSGWGIVSLISVSVGVITSIFNEGVSLLRTHIPETEMIMIIAFS